MVPTSDGWIVQWKPTEALLGTVTPRLFAEETSRLYERLTSDWAEAMRILLRETHEKDKP